MSKNCTFPEQEPIDRLHRNERLNFQFLREGLRNYWHTSSVNRLITEGKFFATTSEKEGMNGWLISINQSIKNLNQNHGLT